MKSKFDKTVEKALGKKYGRKLKKKEKSNLFHYVLKHLGLK